MEGESLLILDLQATRINLFWGTPPFWVPLFLWKKIMNKFKSKNFIKIWILENHGSEILQIREKRNKKIWMKKMREYTN